MEISNRRLVMSFAPALRALAVTETSGKVAYACMRTLQSVDKMAEAYEKTRVEVCKKHAKKDENGDPIKITTDGVESYDFGKDGMMNLLTELDDVLDIKVDIDMFSVDPEEIEKLDKVKAATILSLGSFIKGVEDPIDEKKEKNASPETEKVKEVEQIEELETA